MVIAHNMQAMNASRQYNIVSDSKAKSTEKLSSGYKINRAADDAAGLSISEKMRHQIRGLNRGAANIQDGISVVQIADGALAEVNEMLHRMTELSVQSANGTNSSTDRMAIQDEINEIIREIDRIHTTTEFNEMPLFDGMDETTGTGEKLTKLITTNGNSGKMDVAFNYKGSTVGSSTLDFSNINANNISMIYGKGFSFTCAQGCAESFEFTFQNGGSSSLKQTSLGGSRYRNEYTIDISGCNTGEDVAKTLWEYISTNRPTVDGGQISDVDYLKVGHANGLHYDLANPAKLTVFSLDRGTSNSGKVDCSGLDKEAGKVKNFWIHCSGNSTDGLSIEIERMNAEYIGIDGVDVSTQDGALSAIDMISDASSMVSGMRGRLGAYQNRLEHSYNNNTNTSENTQAGESRLRDTDMADEMVRYSKANILEQVGQSMIAQANQSTQGVLSLLQ